MDESPGQSAAADLESELARVEGVLDAIEHVSGPDGDLARDGVAALARLYGQALAHVVDLVDQETRGRLAGDELVGHLLVLHGLHPEPVDRRVDQALAQAAALMPAVSPELTAIDDRGVAHVRLAESGCGSAGDEVMAALRDVVLAAAPELIDVTTTVPAPAPTVIIPVQAIGRRGC
jgi:hypothetical protein